MNAGSPIGGGISLSSCRAMGEMIHVVPGRPILVDTPPEQMGETELRAHADEEAKHLAEVAKEEEIRQAEMDRLQSEEDENAQETSSSVSSMGGLGGLPASAG